MMNGCVSSLITSHDAVTFKESTIYIYFRLASLVLVDPGKGQIKSNTFHLSPLCVKEKKKKHIGSYLFAKSVKNEIRKKRVTRHCSMKVKELRKFSGEAT